MLTPDYQTDDGRVTLYCADCLDVLREMPNGCADALVTDPPFAFAGGLSNGITSVADDQFFPIGGVVFVLDLNE